MEGNIEQLKQTEQQLQLQKTELEVKMERNAKRAQEELEAVKRQHAEEVQVLRQSNQQLKVGFQSSKIWACNLRTFVNYIFKILNYNFMIF